MTRVEAIAILDGFKYNPLLNDQHFEALDMAVSALSENKGEWIPISERLPETHQDCLLELRSGEMLTGFKAETEPYFYCHGVDGCYVELQNVIAWQPLPEPYKKGGE